MSCSVVLDGISYDFLEKLSDFDRKRLNKWLITIEKNLWNIMELKYEKMKMSR
jgi:hypothetical protein